MTAARKLMFDSGLSNAYALMAAGGNNDPDLLWLTDAGWGTRTNFPNLTTGNINGFSLHPSRNYLAANTQVFEVSRYGPGAVVPPPLYTQIGRGVFDNRGEILFAGVSAIKWDDGYGDVYTPLTIAGSVGFYAYAYSPETGIVWVSYRASDSSDFIRPFVWSDVTGFGAGGVTGLSAVAQAIAVSRTGSAMCWSVASSAVLAARKFSGTVISSPTTATATVAGHVRGFAFSPNNDFIAISHLTTPFISVYPWSDTAGFGAKVADPASLPAGNGFTVAWSADQRYLVVGHQTAPYITAYPWSGAGFGTKFADPADPPPAQVSSALTFI